MAKEDRRSAVVNPPFLVAVSPQGALRRILLASNLASPIVVKDGDEYVLRSAAKKAGWELLSNVADNEKQEAKIVEHLKAEEIDPFGCGSLAPEDLPKHCRDLLAKNLAKVRREPELKPKRAAAK